MEFTKEGPLQVYSNSKVQRPTHGSGERDLRPDQEESRVHRQRVSDPSLPLHVLPHSKETGLVETHHKSQAAEQILQPSQKVQNGDSSRSIVISSSRSLGNVDRLKRYLPSHPHPPVTSKVLGFPLQKHRLLLLCPPVRTIHRPKSVYTGHKGRPGFPPKTRHSRVRLPGRLVTSGPLSSRILPHHFVHRVSPGKPRLDHQHRKVVSHSNPDHNLPRGSSRLPFRKSDSISAKGHNPHRNGTTHAFSMSGSGKTMALSTGPHGQHGRCNPVLQALHETNPNPPSTSLLSSPKSSINRGPVILPGQGPPSMVDVASQCCIGETSQGVQTSLNDHHRCLPLRLGCSLGIRNPIRSLESRGVQTPHQSTGTVGGFSGDLQMGSQSQESPSDDPVRQLNDSSLHKPSGRNQVNFPMPQDLEPFQRPHQGLPPGGLTECHGRCSIQGDSTGDGMVPISGLGQPHLPELRQTHGGPVHHSVQHQTQNVLHEVLPPPGLGDRRSCNSMGQSVRLRLPSVVSNQPGTPQAEGIQHNPPSGSTLLAQPTVVSCPPRDAHRPPIQISPTDQPPHSGERENLASTSSEPPSNSLETLTRRFIDQGLSQEAATIASGSRRRSTLSTYDSRLIKFREWASSQNLDPMEAPVEAIADFFVLLFNEGKQISTIRNYRSAIASIHKGFPDGSSLGSNESLLHLLRGMFNKRPPRKRLPPSWSINDVLLDLF